MNLLKQLNWLLIGQSLYVLLTIGVCLRIIYDTRTTSKTLAYVLLTIFLPVVGMVVYFTVGMNFRLTSLYSKKLTNDEALLSRITQRIVDESRRLMRDAPPGVQQFEKLSELLVRDGHSPLMGGNQLKLLTNGEEKFPDLLAMLEKAERHIHMEYYIYEDDRIGNAIKDVLMARAQAGVEVRFIYDDFGSRAITKRLVPELRAAGVLAFPFYELTLPAFAQRINYRNHRKIVVIDGHTAYVGGINVSDRYINGSDSGNPVFWRDTHLRIDGPGSYFLQNLFLCDWNFCAPDHQVDLDRAYFGFTAPKPMTDGSLVQIGASGPDSRTPTLLYSFMQLISLAQEEILVTTPYFIPGDSLLDALVVASLSGVKVKLLVPGDSDSLLVNAAASSYYAELLRVGVEVHRYRKGFVHAKTIVVDGLLAAIGTANLDYRSFDLNFEVAAFVYDEILADQLRQVFYKDIRHAEPIDFEVWRQRPVWLKLLQKAARMVSPLL